MFSIYGITGRTFSGSLDQWRQVARVEAPARIVALRAASATEGTPAPAVGDQPPRTAAAAYAQAQAGGAARAPLRQVEQIMSAPALVLAGSTPLAEALRLLSLHGHAQAPVLGPTLAPAGMLLRSDLLGALLEGVEPRELLRRTAAECMRTPMPCVSPQAEIRALAELLIDGGWPGVPVVDEAARVVGFVARGDIVRAVAAEAPLELWA